MREANDDRQKIAFLECRDDSRLEQGGFSQSRDAVEHGERIVFDEPHQFGGLAFAAEEKLALAFAVGGETQPRILAVGEGAHAAEAAVIAARGARTLRMARMKSCTTCSSGTPPGTRVAWTSRPGISK